MHAIPVFFPQRPYRFLDGPCQVPGTGDWAACILVQKEAPDHPFRSMEPVRPDADIRPIQALIQITGQGRNRPWQASPLAAEHPAEPSALVLVHTDDSSPAVDGTAPQARIQIGLLYAFSDAIGVGIETARNKGRPGTGPALLASISIPPCNTAQIGGRNKLLPVAKSVKLGEYCKALRLEGLVHQSLGKRQSISRLDPLLRLVRHAQ